MNLNYLTGVLPSHLLEGKDRAAVMKDGYTWSGGPWIIESWKKGETITLVPNAGYWGDKPKLDKVVFQFTADTAAAFQAFKSGQLDAIYPTPQLDAIDQINAGLPGAKVQVEPVSGNLEALWMNNAKPILASTAVRQAISYAIDRAAIVGRIYGPLDVKNPAQSFYPPILSAFGGQDFSTYGLDLAKVEQLMTGDGWAKNADGIWAKGADTASLTITTIAGNKRRELMEQVLQQMLRQLPSKTEMPDLIIDISQTALSSGLTNELFEPEQEQVKEFYAEKPIKLRMVGSYHQFGAFVSGVASLPRVVILTMHDINLKPKDKTSGNARSGALELSGTVKTYRYLDETEVQAQQAADAGKEEKK